MTITLDKAWDGRYGDAIEVPWEVYEILARGGTVMMDDRRISIDDGPFVVSGGAETVERGGPGSGHHGHRGRPGKRGGSLPGTGQKIRDLLHVPATDRWHEVHAAVKAIESVHGIADHVEKLPFKESKALRTGGKYRYQTMPNGEEVPLDMFVVLDQSLNHTTVSMVHEVGHWLDHVMLGDPTKFASEQAIFSSEWRRWLSAVSDTPTMAEVEKFRPGTAQFTWQDREFHKRYSFQYVQNLRDVTEVFARAYAQWVALRSQEPTLLRGIEIMQEHRRLGAAPNVWEWDEFEPVAEAFDDIFREGGWLIEKN